MAGPSERRGNPKRGQKVPRGVLGRAAGAASAEQQGPAVSAADAEALLRTPAKYTPTSFSRMEKLAKELASERSEAEARLQKAHADTAQLREQVEQVCSQVAWLQAAQERMVLEKQAIVRQLEAGQRKRRRTPSPGAAAATSPGQPQPPAAQSQACPADGEAWDSFEPYAAALLPQGGAEGPPQPVGADLSSNCDPLVATPACSTQPHGSAAGLEAWPSEPLVDLSGWPSYNLPEDLSGWPSYNLPEPGLPEA